jgi:hypothetical protein
MMVSDLTTNRVREKQRKVLTKVAHICQKGLHTHILQLHPFRRRYTPAQLAQSFHIKLEGRVLVSAGATIGLLLTLIA